MSQDTPAPPAQLSADTQAIIRDVALRLAKGKKPDVVTAELVKEGWNRPDAESFVAQVMQARDTYRASPEGRAARRSAAVKNTAIGGVIMLIGLAVTLGTYYSAAHSGGGRYTVAWGAVIFGGIQFVRGLIGLAAA